PAVGSVGDVDAGRRTAEIVIVVPVTRQGESRKSREAVNRLARRSLDRDGKRVALFEAALSQLLHTIKALISGADAGDGFKGLAAASGKRAHRAEVRAVSVLGAAVNVAEVDAVRGDTVGVRQLQFAGLGRNAGQGQQDSNDGEPVLQSFHRSLFQGSFV